MAVALSDYLATLRQLVHDGGDNLFPINDKIAYINDGMAQRDWLTGGNRQILIAATVAGQDSYTFAQLGNANIADLVSIALLDGAFRIVMYQLSFTRLNARYRSPSTWRGRPEAYARYANTAIIAPIPATGAYVLESDVTITSTALVLPNDVDPLPPPWTQPVPYYAAFKCKLNVRRWEEATMFKEQFMAQCAQLNGMRAGLMPTAYTGR